MIFHLFTSINESYNENIISLNIKSKNLNITILKQHIALFSFLEKGIFKIKTLNHKIIFFAFQDVFFYFEKDIFYIFAQKINKTISLEKAKKELTNNFLANEQKNKKYFDNLFKLEKELKNFFKAK